MMLGITGQNSFECFENVSDSNGIDVVSSQLAPEHTSEISSECVEKVTDPNSTDIIPSHLAAEDSSQQPTIPKLQIINNARKFHFV